jgi:hypothetical protein
MTRRKSNSGDNKNRRTNSRRSIRQSKQIDRPTNQFGLQLTPDARPIPINPNQLFNIVQENALGTITSSATPGTEIDGAYYFYLAQLDGAAALVAVFDQYRFLQVSVSFIPRCSVTGTTGSVFPTPIGQLLTGIDYDDAATTAAALLRQKETAQITTCTDQQTRTLTPHAALAAYSGAFSSYANMSKMWIDANSQSVQHYGVKFAILNCNFASTIIYDVYARYVVQFRQIQ